LCVEGGVEIDVTGGELPVGVATAAASGPAGFAEAFDALYFRSYQHSFKLLGDRHDAEDVAQEACTRACLRWHTIENPAAWITRVATNLAFDRSRRRRAAAEYAQRERASSVDAVDPHLDLYRALARLPKRQREVVALRYLGDFSEAQTAAALGCAAGTVKAHASRGLRALRESLDLAEGELA
jgi:RNA polymerase sigma-70 factor (sigma-E family)